MALAACWQPGLICVCSRNVAHRTTLRCDQSSREDITMSAMPVQHSLLADGALTSYLIATYALPPTTTCRFWQRGINDVYLVDTGTARFVLRVAPTQWRSPSHFGAEIDLLLFLHQSGLQVPQPVPSADGSYLHTLLAPEGLRYAVLFTFIPGQPYRTTARQ